MAIDRTWTPLDRIRFLARYSGLPIVRLNVDPAERKRRADLENSGLLHPRVRREINNGVSLLNW